MFAFTPAVGQEPVYSSEKIAVLPECPTSGISLTSSMAFVGRIPGPVVTPF